MELLASSVVGVASAAASSLVNAVLSGIVLWLVAEVCLRLLPNIRPANRFIVWASLLVAVICLYFIPIVHGGMSDGVAFAQNRVLHLDARWALLISAVWALVAMVRSVRVIQSAIDVIGIARRSKPVAAESLEHLLRQGLRPTTLCISNEVDRPSVVGFFRPRILIPEGVYGRLSALELEQIIVHEIGHIRRYDDWSNLLQKISLALFPLNPAIAGIERRLCVERELACDDCVLSATSSRKQYAFCLTHLAEYSILRQNLALTLGAWGRRSELAHRVERILNRPKYSIGRKTGYALTALVIGGLSVGGVSLSRIPAMISFSQSTGVASSSSLPKMTNLETPLRGEEASTSAVLVKAVMPEPQRKTVVARHAKRGTLKTLKANRQHAPVSDTMLMRTTFDERIPLPRLIFAGQSSEPSYAALPVGNGWLVIQL